jgi:hypothetical protein
MPFLPEARSITRRICKLPVSVARPFREGFDNERRCKPSLTVGLLKPAPRVALIFAAAGAAFAIARQDDRHSRCHRYGALVLQPRDRYFSFDLLELRVSSDESRHPLFRECRSEAISQ